MLMLAGDLESRLVSRVVDCRSRVKCKHAVMDLPLVSREWKNGSNRSYNCTPFLHSLLTKGKWSNEQTTRRSLKLAYTSSAKSCRVSGLGL